MRVRAMTGQRFGSGGDEPRPTPEALMYGRARKPACPVHHVEMLAGSSPRGEYGGVRYRYCPVPGCECSVKESR